jgi:hypothetical protein
LHAPEEEEEEEEEESLSDRWMDRLDLARFTILLDVGLISNKKSQIPIRACQTGHASVGLFSLSKTKKRKNWQVRVGYMDT